MSCNSCGKDGLPGGCKNNGLCGISGCNKLNSVDWLANVIPPSSSNKFLGCEIRFKNGRKEFYHNLNELSLYIGDVVVLEANPGYDIGIVSLTGDLVKAQMNKRGQLIQLDKLPNIIRKASSNDIEKWEKFRSREADVMLKARVIARSLDLNMKISDVEYQGDGKKATFYYTAEGRVDFRELVKKFAEKFKARIEMKQIGMRQEASRIGGIGSCGRELCCSTWLTDFRSVSTSAARYQQLALNPEKLAGQCGKLKCCLNYELDNYMEELKKFPNTNTKLNTDKGKAIYQKMDIFKNTMTYAYPENPNHFIEISLERVHEIIELNNNGKIVDDLLIAEDVKERKVSWENVVGQDELTRFDKDLKKKSKRRSKNKRYNKRRGDRNEKN